MELVPWYIETNEKIHTQKKKKSHTTTKKQRPMWKITFEYDCLMSHIAKHIYKCVCDAKIYRYICVYMARGTGLTRLILSHAIFQAAQSRTKNHFWCSIFYDDVSWL